VEGWVEGWEGNDIGSGRSAEGHAVFVYLAVRKWAGDESGGVDCGGACGVFFDGIVGAVGWGESEAGEHQHECDFDDGEAGGGLDDYIEPHRCSGKVPGADAATFQKYAEAAEKGCPVSKVLNAKISMTAKLG